MTTKIRSPTGLEICTLMIINFCLLSTFTIAAPLQETVDIQEYSEGCYYNYNHYNEGDRISTNEPCLNCTCHNKMLMCYLRVCPFTKPIGHDCVVEKREDQCCPIITCPEVPVELSHQVDPGTELAIPEKYGCTIDNKFYTEGAQVPSHPNKPCELCYCIKNRTSCLMQECTLHIDGCQPIYNKDSCCPVRYNCDHENELLDDSTTTTVKPTSGFLLTTVSSLISAECHHQDKTYADGSHIKTSNSCENCYCMHGDIVCAVQKCDIPTMEVQGKVCQAGELLEGECCPSNYICEDINKKAENEQNEAAMNKITQEDEELQKHIDKDVTKEKEDSMNLEKTTVATSEEDLVTETSIPTNKNEDNIIYTPSNESQEIETKTESTMILSTIDKMQDINQIQIEDIPLSIPGEGSCLIDGETYSNNTRVATSNECEEYCICLSSLVTCKPVECENPPFKSCTIDIKSKFECCPIYICHDNNVTKPLNNEDETKATTTASMDHYIESSTLPSEINYVDQTSISIVSENLDTTSMKQGIDLSEAGSTENHLFEDTITPDFTTVSNEIKNENMENDLEGSGLGEKLFESTTLKYPSSNNDSTTISANKILEDKVSLDFDENINSPLTIKPIALEEESDNVTTESNNLPSATFETNHSQSYLPPLEINQFTSDSDINNMFETTIRSTSNEIKESNAINLIGSDEHVFEEHTDLLSEFTTENTHFVQHTSEIDVITVPNDLLNRSNNSFEDEPKLDQTVTESNEPLTTPIFIGEYTIEQNNSFPASDNLFVDEINISTILPILNNNEIQSQNKLHPEINEVTDDIPQTILSNVPYEINRINNNEIQSPNKLHPETNEVTDDIPQTTLSNVPYEINRISTPKQTNNDEKEHKMDPNIGDIIQVGTPKQEETIIHEQTTIIPNDESNKKDDSSKTSKESQPMIEEQELVSTTQETSTAKMSYSSESNKNIISVEYAVNTEEVHDGETTALPLELSSEKYSHENMLGEGYEVTTKMLENQEHQINESTESTQVKPNTYTEVKDSEVASDIIYTTEMSNNQVIDEIEKNTDMPISDSTEQYEISIHDLNASTIEPTKSDSNNYEVNTTINSINSENLLGLETTKDLQPDTSSDDVSTTVISSNSGNVEYLENVTQPNLNENIDEVTTTVKSTNLAASPHKEIITELNDLIINDVFTTTPSVESEVSAQYGSTTKYENNDEITVKDKESNPESESNLNIGGTYTTVKNIDSSQTENDVEFEAVTNISESYTTVNTIEFMGSSQKESDLETEGDTGIKVVYTTEKDLEASSQKNNYVESSTDLNVDEKLATINSVDPTVSHEKESNSETEQIIDVYFTTVNDKEYVTSANDFESFSQKHSGTESEKNENIMESHTTVSSLDFEQNSQEKNYTKLDTNIEDVFTTAKTISSEEPSQKKSDPEPTKDVPSVTTQINDEAKTENYNILIVTENPEINASRLDSIEISNDEDVSTDTNMELTSEQIKENNTVEVTTENIEERQYEFTVAPSNSNNDSVLNVNELNDLTIEKIEETSTLSVLMKPINHIMNITFDNENTQNTEVDSVTDNEYINMPVKDELTTTEQIEISEPIYDNILTNKHENVAPENSNNDGKVDVTSSNQFPTTERIETSEAINEQNMSKKDENITTEDTGIESLDDEKIQVSSISTDGYNNGIKESNEMYTTSSPYSEPSNSKSNENDASTEYIMITETDVLLDTFNESDKVINTDSELNSESQNETEIPTINVYSTENSTIYEDKTTQNPNSNELLSQNEKHKEDSTTQKNKSPGDQLDDMIELNTTTSPNNINEEMIGNASMATNTQHKPSEVNDSSEMTAEMITSIPSLISKVTEESLIHNKSPDNATSALPQSTYSPLPQTGMYAPPQYSSYPEDEYTDEDESEIFGPGTCRYGGKLYVSAQQIPRDDPCDFCFCFRSDIICLQQSCPPPISGCREEPIHGFCCPRYECPVSMGTVMNITTSTTTKSTTLPPHFLSHNYHGSAKKSGCFINGVSYKIGDEITSSNGPCMQCL
ncbi:hypothetical protein ACFFRR_005746 [Megaselia abdita]